MDFSPFFPQFLLFFGFSIFKDLQRGCLANLHPFFPVSMRFVGWLFYSIYQVVGIQGVAKSMAEGSLGDRISMISYH